MNSVPLTELRLELLQKCTLACVHCSAESSPLASRALDPELVIRLLREGAELGLKSVVFTGGEPLIERHLDAYISEASSLGKRATIFTAGYMKPEAVKARITDLASAGLQQVNVSIYSADPATNARITRKPESLQCSQLVLTEAVRQGLMTEIHFVPMAPNIADFEGVAVWAAEHGVSRLSVLKYVPQGRGQLAYDTLAPAPTDERRLRARVENAIALHPTLHVHVGPSFGFLGLSKAVSCDAGFGTLSVRSDGLVFPCDAFKGIPDTEFLRSGESRHDLRLRSLAEVWQSCPYLCATRAFILANTPVGGMRCAEGCVSQCIYRKAL